MQNMTARQQCSLHGGQVWVSMSCQYVKFKCKRCSLQPYGLCGCKALRNVMNDWDEYTRI
jgi:hypothetical protein